MNRATFERLHHTHIAWAADELEAGSEAGRKWAETDASYDELRLIRVELPKAARFGEAPAFRLPESMSSWWTELGLKETGVSASFQIGFMQGACKVLKQYEAALQKAWATPKGGR